MSSQCLRQRVLSVPRMAKLLIASVIAGVAFAQTAPPVSRACYPREEAAPLDVEILDDTRIPWATERCNYVQMCDGGILAGDCGIAHTLAVELASDDFIPTGQMRPSTFALAAWLEAHPDLVRGRSVIEVGRGASISCDSGMGALSALRLGASSALVTDISPLLLELANYNVRHGLDEQQHKHFQCMRMVPGDSAAIAQAAQLTNGAAGFDLVLAAGMELSTEATTGTWLRTLSGLMHRTSVLVVIDQRRSAGGLGALAAALRAQGHGNVTVAPLNDAVDILPHWPNFRSTFHPALRAFRDYMFDCFPPHCPDGERPPHCTIDVLQSNGMGAAPQQSGHEHR